MSDVVFLVLVLGVVFAVAAPFGYWLGDAWGERRELQRIERRRRRQWETKRT